MEKRKSLLCGGILCTLLLASAAAILLQRHTEGGRIARVYSDSELVREIDLDAVREPYSFTIESESGSNEITVRHGAVAVTSASCPDKLCVHTGYIDSPALPVVCMPNKLVITVGGCDCEADAAVY